MTTLVSELQQLLARPCAPITSLVERGAVTRFAEAVGDPILLDVDGQLRVPSTFLASLPYERPPLPAGGDDHLINAENSFTFDRAPVIGEAITTTASFTRVAQRGPLVELGLEVRYADARGARVGAVTVRFIVDFEGVCAGSLGEASREPAPPLAAVPRFVPHGVTRARGEVPAGAEVDLASLRTGDRLPPFTKAPLSTMQFVQYAGASGDFNPLHYDSRYAARAGFPDVIAPGLLKMAFFAQHMMLCAGPSAELRRLEAKYVGFDVPGQELTSHAMVREVATVEGRRIVHADLSLQDRHGDAATLGRAILESAMVKAAGVR
ncbi:MaoC family dehydratase N-terminal domain-containing protein [Pendulispora rubella]|uniref:MaoC family dehydratase N-terminal domain-containing protein n=1 Tax=Pendulispora rubella TaxID=2741070 RepID=A0ABZ2L0X7_9BACT